MAETITSLMSQLSLPSGVSRLAETLGLTVLPLRTVVQLRLGLHALNAASDIRIAGQPLPGTINTWTGEDPAICRIAPDSWLLLSSLPEAADLLHAAHSACAGRLCAVTDLSDAYVTLVLDGPLAAEILARGCGLNLAATEFGFNACARTRLAQLTVLIRRTALDRFECVVDRSTGKYLIDWMRDAAAGLD